MVTTPAAFQAHLDSTSTIADADLLPRHPIFRTRDLEHARQHLWGVFVEARFAYLSQERRLDFRHRQAKLGPIAVNSMQYGTGIMVTAPPFGDFYLLQFTLTGRCQLRQDGNCTEIPAGSVAIINPFRAFAKAWLPGTRQLLIRIDRHLLEREFRAWTGSDETEQIEFDPLPVEGAAKVGTLTRYVRMLCDDLRNASSHLEHPLVRDRIASALVSTLLVSMPHNRERELDAAALSIAPFFVRRVEHFIEENARHAINLEDLAGVAGVSTRALQMGFRRFRNTTPTAHLRAVRLELARTELACAGRKGGSVASVANDCGFGNLGRFAADYKARFNELPSQTLIRGSVGRNNLAAR
jgi:AraC-like DNA-binding protein